MHSCLARVVRTVLIPDGVFEELQRPSTPDVVQEWMSARPDWLEVRQTEMQPDAALQLLGVGERQAICLAQELKAAAVVIDEERGRKEAKRRGLSVIGTLGVLRDAAERGILSRCHRCLRVRERRIFASRRKSFRGFCSAMRNEIACDSPSAVNSGESSAPSVGRRSRAIIWSAPAERRRFRCPTNLSLSILTKRQVGSVHTETTVKLVGQPSRAISHDPSRLLPLQRPVAIARGSVTYSASLALFGHRKSGL